MALNENNLKKKKIKINRRPLSFPQKLGGGGEKKGNKENHLLPIKAAKPLRLTNYPFGSHVLKLINPLSKDVQHGKH